MYNRSRIAIVLGVIVLVMAIILRVRWQYNPPATDENISLIDVFQYSLTESLEPEELETTAIATTVLTTLTGEVMSVTPDATQQLTYAPGEPTPLITGLQPTVLASADGFDVGFMFGERYLVKHYDAAWQPSEGDITLVEELQIINGQLPFTHFSATATGYILLYATTNAHGTVDLRAKQFSDFSTVSSETTILTDLPSTTTIVAAVTNTGIAVLLNEANQSSRIQTYTLAGVRLADASLSQFVSAQAVVGDSDAWIVFGQDAAGFHIEKLSAIGEVSQTVNVTLAEAAAGTAPLSNVVRSGEYLVVVLADRLLVLADNLSTIYGEYVFTDEQLHRQVTVKDDQLWLTYDTPISLTEYQIHTLTWSLVRPVL